MDTIEVTNLNKQFLFRQSNVGLSNVGIFYLSSVIQLLAGFSFFVSDCNIVIAAFLQISGKCLKELSLNNIKKVGNNTTISLAGHSSLNCLDLSWCRNLHDEALGLIVDSCLSLKILKLFNCT